MNTHEDQRVIDGLKALSGGLVVTEQDIIEARGKVQRQFQDPGPRRRGLVLAAAAVIVVAGIVTFQAISGRDDSAPPVDQPPGPQAAAVAALEAAIDPYVYGQSEDEFLAGRPPTKEDLVGVWLLRTPYSAPMVVYADGRWEEGVPNQYWVAGENRLTGRTLTRHYDQTGCPKGNGIEDQTWQASVSPDGSLRLQFASGTNVCTAADNREAWDRLGPGRSPITDFLRDSAAAINWETHTLGRVPAGLYISPESRHLLTVSAQGSYQFYDTLNGQELVPADQGVLTVDGDAGDPVTVSASCRGGSLVGTVQQGSTPEVAGIIDDMGALRIDTTADSCASGVGTDVVWVRIFSA